MRRWVLTASVCAALFLPCGAARAAERAGTVTFDIEVAAPPGARNVKLWFPYPTSDPDQAISNLSFDGNYSTFTFSREPNSGALYLFTEWRTPIEHRRLKV